MAALNENRLSAQGSSKNYEMKDSGKGEKESKQVENLSPCDLLYQHDSNVLVASWIDDLGYKQKEFDDKILFYNSECILNTGEPLQHLQKENKKLFIDKGIEFCCKKGKKNVMNQDNFFVINEGKLKIMGVFDGHGLNGSLVSSYAMGSMVDFIRNSKRFKDIFRPNADGSEKEYDDEEMNKAIRKCFRYVQDKVRDQFKNYLINKKIKQRKEDITDIVNSPDRKINNVDLEGISRDEDVSIDSDEREFLENISWDTSSDEEDIEKDEQIMDSKIFRPDGDMDAATAAQI